MKSTASGMMTTHGQGKSGEADKSAPVFQRTLTLLSQEQHQLRLAQMKKEIEGQGERLCDKVCVREYEKYRRLIREFLDEIISNGYTFHKEDSYGARGRHRFFAMVKVVDDKLDQLGKEVMSEQADRIDILSKVDEIRGLLVDMMF